MIDEPIRFIDYVIGYVGSFLFVALIFHQWILTPAKSIANRWRVK